MSVSRNAGPDRRCPDQQKPMFSSPFRGFSPDPTIEGVYGMIVAQARSPSFYRDYGVPDTVDGRFDMIVLHLVLVLRRLRQSQSQAQIRANVPALGQQIFDRFCRDMDHNFREMGIGDLAVPALLKHSTAGPPSMRRRWLRTTGRRSKWPWRATSLGWRRRGSARGVSRPI